MNRNEILNKWIPYCIIGAFLLFALFLCAFLRAENIRIQKIDLSSLPVSDEQCSITSITRESDAFLIEGVYFARDQYLDTINLSCIISDPDENNLIGYQIPTEFFEVCDEQTIYSHQRDMAGFRARIDLDSWRYGNGTFDILLLNRCNECDELIQTENHIEIGGNYID